MPHDHELHRGLPEGSQPGQGDFGDQEDDRGAAALSAVPGELRWRCRRGMRELDELLQGYLERSWSEAGEGERAAFRQLLELQDPDLAAYLLGHDTPPPELQALVDRLRKR
ncbi:MAG: succinate dehydrogenase assembly factor 2 [Steroidobacteraceae bacterium]